MTREEFIKRKGLRPIYFNNGFSLKELNAEKREVHLKLNAFDNKDDDGDIVMKGAFTKSINERGPKAETNRKIAFLKYHRMTMPIGPFKELWEQDDGLHAIGLVDKTSEGDDTLVQIQSKTLNQASIGFEYIFDKLEWSDEQEAFIAKELNLWEGSLLVLGSNELTGVLEVRGKEFESQVAEIMADLDKHLKGIEYKSQYDLRRVFSKVLTLVEHSTSKPLKDTLKPEIKAVDWSHIAKAIQLTTKNKTK